ncbi:hypothetical protein PQQ99_29585 [Paraburkholderia sediminicola]|uniref:hypothetical protein n=1 Tax=Paraburkholderia TaxID=1822464 RepID=UPI0038B78C67
MDKSNYRWRICALLFFATTIDYLDRQVLGLLKLPHHVARHQNHVTGFSRGDQIVETVAPHHHAPGKAIGRAQVPLNRTVQFASA